MKLIFGFLATLAFFAAFASPANAQSQCSEFSFSPNPVDTSSSFQLIKSDGLISGEAVRLEFPTGQEFILDCQADPGACSGNPTSLFNIEANTLPVGTNLSSLTYLNAAGNPSNCPMSVTVVEGDTDEFCSPLGISSLSSNAIAPNESIVASGCLGAAGCNGAADIVIQGPPGTPTREVSIQTSPGSCSPTGQFTSSSIGGFEEGVYTAQLYIGLSNSVGEPFQFTVELGENQNPEEGTPCTSITGGMICSGTFQRSAQDDVVCTFDWDQCITCAECQLPNCTRSQQIQCERSGSNTAAEVSGECRRTIGIGSVDTAIGCIPFNVIGETARFFLAWSLSVGGGIALLLVGISGFMLATSSGNPQKVESAKSLFWAAITGLGMLVLSVFLLRFIGVEVLELFG